MAQIGYFSTPFYLPNHGRAIVGVGWMAPLDVSWGNRQSRSISVCPVAVVSAALRAQVLIGWSYIRTPSSHAKSPPGGFHVNIKVLVRGVAMGQSHVSTFLVISTATFCVALRAGNPCRFMNDSGCFNH